MAIDIDEIILASTDYYLNYVWSTRQQFEICSRLFFEKMQNYLRQTISSHVNDQEPLNLRKNRILQKYCDEVYPAIREGLHRGVGVEQEYQLSIINQKMLNGNALNEMEIFILSNPNFFQYKLAAFDNVLKIQIDQVSRDFLNSFRWGSVLNSNVNPYQTPPKNRYRG